MQPNDLQLTRLQRHPAGLSIVPVDLPIPVGPASQLRAGDLWGASRGQLTYLLSVRWGPGFPGSRSRPKKSAAALDEVLITQRPSGVLKMSHGHAQVRVVVVEVALPDVRQIDCRCLFALQRSTGAQGPSPGSRHYPTRVR